MRLPLPTLFQAPTLEALAEIITQKSALPIRRTRCRPVSVSTLTPLRAAGGSRRCSASIPTTDWCCFIRRWRTACRRISLSTACSRWAWTTDEAPLTSLEEMAARYLRDIRRFQPVGPYHLGGYSLGGVLAAEMARQLHADGERVGLLALFDTYAPVAYQQNLIDKPRLQRMAGHFSAA